MGRFSFQAFIRNLLFIVFPLAIGKVVIERLEVSEYLPLNFEHLNFEPPEGKRERSDK